MTQSAKQEVSCSLDDIELRINSLIKEYQQSCKMVDNQVLQEGIAKAALDYISKELIKATTLFGGSENNRIKTISTSAFSMFGNYPHLRQIAQRKIDNAVLSKECKIVEKHADDSSDDEAEGIDIFSITKDISNNWNSFKTDKKFVIDQLKSLNVTEEELRLSFITHTAGRAVFFQNAAKNVYKKLKIKKLPKSKVIGLDKIEGLESIVLQAIEAAINCCGDGMNEAVRDQFGVSKILGLAISKNKSLLEKISALMVENKIKLLRCLQNPNLFKKFFPEINAVIARIKNDIAEIVAKTECKQSILSKRRETYSKSPKKIQTGLEEYIRYKVIEDLNCIIDDYDQDVMDNHSLDESGEVSDLNKILSRLEDEESCPDLQEKMRSEIHEKVSLLQEECRQGAPYPAFSSFSVSEFMLWENRQSDASLINAKYDELVAEEDDLSTDATLFKLAYGDNVLLSDEAQRLLKDRTIFNNDRVVFRINKNLEPDDFCSLLAEFLKKTIPLQVRRGTLPRSYAFSKNNSLEFMANLMLSNRSQVRVVREAQRCGLSPDIAMMHWLSDSFTLHEQQTITQKNLARSDYVNPQLKGSKYVQYYSTIDKIKTIYSLTDKDIVSYVRDAAQGKRLPDKTFRDEDKFFIHHLAYLLLGTEVVRNPASLILQQMMFDLIFIEAQENGQALDWRLALCREVPDFKNGGKRYVSGGYIPMTAEKEDKIVSSARWIHQLYNNAEQYMPSRYQYVGKCSDARRAVSLIKAEAKLAKIWIKHFLRVKKPQKMPIDELYHNIVLQVSRWYPHPNISTTSDILSKIFEDRHQELSNTSKDKSIGGYPTGSPTWTILNNIISYLNNDDFSDQPSSLSSSSPQSSETLTTKGDGNCAFHAALGTLNSQGIVEHSTVQAERERTAQAVRESDAQSPFRRYIVACIRELVMDTYDHEKNNRALQERHQVVKELMAGLLERYARHNQVDRWEPFYTILLQDVYREFREEVIRNSRATLPSEPLSESQTMRLMFHDALNSKTWDAQEIMRRDYPELFKAYESYSRNPEIDWEAAITPDHVSQYATHIIGKNGEYVIGEIFGIIAHLNQITIHYYSGPQAQAVVYNPEQSKQVFVQHNGINHYEKMSSVPRRERAGQTPPDVGAMDNPGSSSSSSSPAALSSKQGTVDDNKSDGKRESPPTLRSRLPLRSSLVLFPANLGSSSSSSVISQPADDKAQGLIEKIRQQLTELSGLSSQNFEAYAEYMGQLVKYETLSKNRPLKYEETSQLWKINEALQQLLITLSQKKMGL